MQLVKPRVSETVAASRLAALANKQHTPFPFSKKLSQSLDAARKLERSKLSTDVHSAGCN